MDEVQVDVVEPEPGERTFEASTGGISAMVIAAQLGRDDQLSPIDRRLGDTAADPDLVVVPGGRVEQPVPDLDRVADDLGSIVVVQGEPCRTRWQGSSCRRSGPRWERGKA